MMTRALALELSEHRINVNAVAPGAIEVERNREVFEDAEFREAILSSIPQKRLGNAGDIIGAVAFLCSPESDYITGQTIYVDGGMLLQS